MTAFQLQSTYNRASDYVKSVAPEYLSHLWTQRNLADNPDIARHRFA